MRAVLNTSNEARTTSSNAVRGEHDAPPACLAAMGEARAGTDLTRPEHIWVVRQPHIRVVSDLDCQLLASGAVENRGYAAVVEGDRQAQWGRTPRQPSTAAPPAKHVHAAMNEASGKHETTAIEHGAAVEGEMDRFSIAERDAATINAIPSDWEMVTLGRETRGEEKKRRVMGVRAPKSASHTLDGEPATQMTLNTLRGREPQACKVTYRREDADSPRIGERQSAIKTPSLNVYLQMARRSLRAILKPARHDRARGMLTSTSVEKPESGWKQPGATVNRTSDVTWTSCVDPMLLANRNSPPVVSGALQISLVSAAQRFRCATPRGGSEPCGEALARAPSSQFRDTANGERAYQQGPGIKPAAWVAPAKCTADWLKTGRP
ncbi:hypothetical protein V8D89_009626 [Ganoderma adspersum]